jgi:hypothetical protein
MLLVRNGAVAEFPYDNVTTAAVIQGGILMPTAASHQLNVSVDAVVQGNGYVGCFGCAESAELQSGVTGCAGAVTFIPWCAWRSVE